MTAAPKPQEPDLATVDAVASDLFRAHDQVAGVGLQPRDFDMMTGIVVESWRAAARTAISLGARPPRGDLRARLAGLMDTNSINYLGTGLTLREFLQLGHAEKIAASWMNQSREERRRRLSAVMRLSVELARIRESTLFATRLAEMAIEAVIEGDWKMVEEWADALRLAEEHESTQQTYEPVFVVFRELLLQALRAEKDVSA